MGMIQGFAPARAARLASLLLNRHSPQEIGLAIEILVDVLDVMGGDPDAEPNGDEQDAAWVEWHTLRAAQKRGPNLLAGHEDDEDDDPREANGDERDTNGDEGDTNNAEDEVLAGGALQYRASGPGCPISDPGGCETGSSGWDS